MIPRYFHVRSEKSLQLLAPVALLDHLVQEAAQPRDVVVGVDMAGQLGLWDTVELEGEQKAQLSRQELRRRPRRLRALPLWLMEVSALEQPGKVSGLNDPVHLIGRLTGPWPPPPSGPRVFEGELSLTRGDLLGGLVDARIDALEVPNAAGDQGLVLHAWLPGDREDELLAGRGGILAYPMVPAELSPLDRCNELLCMELLCGILEAMQQDVRADSLQNHPLHAVRLPTPDRAALIRAWEAEGFEREGERMSRRPTGKGFFGELASVLAKPEIRPIPPQAELEPLLKLSRELLPLLPGWPEPRYRCLRALRMYGQPTMGPARPDLPVLPKNTASEVTSEKSGPAPAEVPAAAPFRRAPEPDWLQDFGGGSPPRRTPLRAPDRRPEYTKDPSPPTGRPAWMDDFE